MIFTEKKITINNNECKIDSPVVLYRGDYNVEVRFTIVSSPYKYSNKQETNVIEQTEASYGQLVIKTPGDKAPIFSEITATKRGAITFTITAEMIDEVDEIGDYTFQIRLLDENKESRATIPEVKDGIEIREPIAQEDVTSTNEVNVATVGYALTTAGTTEDVFDAQGNYNKTTWGTGDRITDAKLNKIEAAIDGVNKKANNIPTKTSQLENDSDYATITQVNLAIDNAQLGYGDFEIDNIKVKNIDVNKINFDKYSHINSNNYSIRKVAGINWETIVPIFETSTDIATVTIDLTRFEFEDLYFKPTNISGQSVIYYTEGVAGKNLTYNNIITGKDKNFVYDEVSGYCKVDVNSIKATYSTIVFAMNKAECEVYSTAKNIIGSQHIKDESIYPRHIADKEMLRDTICMSSNNYFDVNLCEKKYSGGYDVGTGLPIWTVNNTTADKYRTITLPIGENGHIIIKKPNYYDNVVVQCYYLKQDGTLANNFTTKGINKAENTYPYNVNPYTEVNSDYIKVDCANAKAHDAVKLTITYHYANEILEDLVYINYKNAFIPEWLDAKGIVSNIQNSSDIEIILPSKYIVATGRELDIHYNNVVRYYNTDYAQRIRMDGQFRNFKKFAKITPTDEMRNFTAKLRFYKDDTLNISLQKDINVEIVKTTEGTGTKKVLIIGDSYTAHNVYVRELKQLFDSDSSMNIELLGTRGTSPCNHEGRAGWRAYEYVNCASGVYGDKVANAFYNPATSKFDFSYYMSQNNYNNVDIVCLNLGTNDLIRSNNNTVEIMLDSYNYMINSIKAYNSNIKILIGLAGARGLADLDNKGEIDSALTSTKALINEFDNRESDNIYVVPYYLNLDPNHDFNFDEMAISNRWPDVKMRIANDSVHPSNTGYCKIADVIYAYIKYVSM